MVTRQTFTVALDAQEIDGMHHEIGEVKRSEINKYGALGVANNTGVMRLLLGNHVTLQLWLHEDENGLAVVDVLDHHGNRACRFNAERSGFVPSRTAKAPRKAGS